MQVCLPLYIFRSKKICRKSYLYCTMSIGLSKRLEWICTVSSAPTSFILFYIIQGVSLREIEFHCTVPVGYTVLYTVHCTVFSYRKKWLCHMLNPDQNIHNFCKLQLIKKTLRILVLDHYEL